MDVLELLINRRSTSRLIEPTPTGEQLQNIPRVGIHAPDRKSIQSWYFLVIEEERREHFGAILEQGTIIVGNGNEAVDKARGTPFHTPLIITMVARCEENHKVPRWEQEISAGCAVMTTQMVVVAQGSGGIWHNDTLTEGPAVHEASGCREQDKIVGLLYLGTPQSKASMLVNTPDPAPFMTYF